jgi:hypothetical protein
VSYRIEDALAADAARIDLNSRQARPAPLPDITVTPAAVSPGELLLTDIAAGFLALASPEQVPLHPSAARPGPLSQAADGLALHNGEHGQFLHLLASGVTPEYTWTYGTIANRMPVLRLREPNGRWHTARPASSAPLRDTDDFMLRHRVVPPLDHGTRGSTWWPPGNRPRSGPGCRSPESAILDSAPGSQNRPPHPGQGP